MKNMENFFISLIIIVIIFLITREFWCWYFKINKVAGLLEQQLEEQKKSNQLLRSALNKEASKNNPIKRTDENIEL